MADSDKQQIQKKKHTKDQILDVVELLCAKIGPYRLKHTTIAKEMNIKPPSLYAHYPSMTAILAATTRRALGEISSTYLDIEEACSPIEALNISQNRQIDLLVARPGIARLVLFDLSQPGGAETVAWDTPEIVQITEKERYLFNLILEQGVVLGDDFELWFSSKMGALYSALSYEWLRSDKITLERINALKCHLKVNIKNT
ncbi:MAG: TetR/AcrR family transcriptional regulator [Marinomonadaceae bacterium]